MPENVRVHAHRVLLVHALQRGPGRRRPLAMPQGMRPCARGEDEALRLYLTATATQLLHARRFELAEPQRGPVPDGGLLERLEVADLGGNLALLCAVVRLPGRPALDRALDFADTVRLRGPLWPGQPLIHWRTHGGSDATDSGIDDLVEKWLPGWEPVFGDMRVHALHYVDLECDPGRERRYAISAFDPSTMPPPIPSELDRFEARNTYRRWEAAGTWYGYTHMSAGIIHAGQRAEWLCDLVGHLYLDVAAWTVAVAAARHRLVSRLLAGAPLTPSVWRAHVRLFESERLTEQDQGRWMMQTWLRAIEADRGDDALLQRAIGAGWGHHDVD